MPFFEVPDEVQRDTVNSTSAIHAELGATRLTYSLGVDREVAAPPETTALTGHPSVSPRGDVRHEASIHSVALTGRPRLRRVGEARTGDIE
jgi:hypothetical protein